MLQMKQLFSQFVVESKEDEMGEQPVYVIHETSDYGKFKANDRNRKMYQSHIDELVASMQERGYLPEYPVTVNADGVIMDGHHRVAAAMIVGCPIYYVVSSTLKVDDIGPLQDMQKRWLMDDYLHSYTVGGNSEYAKIGVLIKDFPWAAPSTVADIAYYGDVIRSGSTSRFRDGAYVANDIDFARKVLLACLDFAPYLAHYRSTLFIRTMRNVMSDTRYDHARMVRKLQYAGGRLRRCPDMKSYIEALSAIYNWKVKDSERLELRQLNPSSKFARKPKVI